MRQLLALVLPCLLSGSITAQAPPAKPPAVKTEELTLEKIFPRRGLFGPSAHGMAFAHDGKYAAWLHRADKKRSQGSDLWLFEVATGKVSRITTPEKMAKWQASARKFLEAAKKPEKKTTEAKDGKDDNKQRYNGV